MPPAVLHMSVAKALADELAASTLDAERGAYYLGSTAPDVRAITRWDRKITHFFDLTEFAHQDSIAALFDAYPELADRTKLNKETAAFLAGYLTHLVLDQRWIEDVYRPLFGERSPLAGSQRANGMDRVIQFELDRREREDRSLLEDMRAQILSSALEISVGFLDLETIRRWREVNLDFLQAPATWERFRNFAGRHLGQYGITEPEQIDQFMAGIPEMLKESVDHVGWERVQDYLDGARRRARDAIREYLG